MPRRSGAMIRGWTALTWLAYPLIVRHLRKRRDRGKEHPTRWREKLGYASAPRPSGPVVWCHAVGLGEVLALRGLIVRLSHLRPDVGFVVTSGTRASADVMARNLPPRTVHQFVPVDSATPARRFLDHWRPDLSIWAEQELWPGLVVRTDVRGCPLALVNARMTATGHASRARVRGAYADMLARFALVSAQSRDTADRLTDLGAGAVRVDGSLKPIAPPLMADAGALSEVRAQIGTRRVWVLASSHPEDEALAFAAHRLVLAQDPQALLIVAPRVPDRRDDMARALDESGLSHTTRSLGQGPEAQVWLADTFGELGLWYRVAQVAYVGGSNSAVEGHNPWEPVILHCPVLHGPRTAHFTADYRELDAAGAARCATTPSDLAESVVGPGGQTPCALRPMAQATRCLAQDRMDRLDDLCHRLLDLIPDVVTSDQTS